jgi:hypothetical protein
MALNINPLAIAVGAIAIQAASQASNENSATLPSEVSAGSKQSLDDKIRRLSGDITSGLGQAQEEFSTALGQLDDKISETIGDLDFGSLTDTVKNFSEQIPDIEGSLDKLTGGNLAGGLQELANGVSKSAGILNDILSLKRGANLPAGAELFQATGPSIKVQPNAKNDWRVKINTNWAMFNSPLFKRLEESGGVVFPYTPTINLSTSANYNDIETIHNNYPFKSYQNSKIDEISIQGEFSVQNESDAEYWIASMVFFKTATKMFYGQSENAGNPPIICHLSGYGSYMFDRVPVVIQNFNVSLGDDVDYIKYGSGSNATWVPTLSEFSLLVGPVYNRSDMRKFSLQQYAQGNMISPSGGKYL